MKGEFALLIEVAEPGDWGCVVAGLLLLDGLLVLISPTVFPLVGILAAVPDDIFYFLLFNLKYKI